ncbi:MAG: pyridoxamine 5'-phosphate oxidase [Planctomycetota bacterium]|jgi:pyridoxamine 5'-phosphate oxidase
MDFDRPPADPIDLFRQWLAEAERRTSRPNPNAMTLATIDPDGRPSARIVLLKSIDHRGAVFFTNRLSRKGQALRAHPLAALVFHWDEIGRQVRMEGRVSDVDAAESDAYFRTRHPGSRLGAWASRQSEPLASRAVLEEAVRRAERRFAGGDIPCPPHWGGYRVALDRITFWQAGAARLHDVVAYTRGEDGHWRAGRVYP